MRRQLVRSFAGVALLAGCGTSSLLLQRPVETGCTTAGLKGCPQLSEGILQYVDGDKEGGVVKIRRGALDNSPGQIQAFVQVLKKVQSTPGTESIRPQINEVVELLYPSDPKRVAIGPSAPDNPIQSDSGPHDRSPSVVSAEGHDGAPRHWDTPLPLERSSPWAAPPEPTIETATVMPSANSSTRLCDVAQWVNSIGTKLRGYCVRVAEGPLVVTDLYSSAGCSAELFVLAGSPESPRWAVSGALDHPIRLGGAQLFVAAHDYLVVGALARKESEFRSDVSCSVTWSGRRAQPSGIDEEAGF